MSHGSCAVLHGMNLGIKRNIGWNEVDNQTLQPIKTWGHFCTYWMFCENSISEHYLLYMFVIYETFRRNNKLLVRISGHIIFYDKVLIIKGGMKTNAGVQSVRSLPSIWLLYLFYSFFSLFALTLPVKLLLQDHPPVR